MHYSRIMPVANGARYFTSTAVFINEILKLAICMAVVVRGKVKENKPWSLAILWEEIMGEDSWKLAIPAALYTVTTTSTPRFLPNSDNSFLASKQPPVRRGIQSRRSDLPSHLSTQNSHNSPLQRNNATSHPLPPKMGLPTPPDPRCSPRSTPFIQSRRRRHDHSKTKLFPQTFPFLRSRVDRRVNAPSR